jgi:hypothetical protein
VDWSSAHKLDLTTTFDWFGTIGAECRTGQLYLIVVRHYLGVDTGAPASSNLTSPMKADFSQYDCLSREYGGWLRTVMSVRL